MKGKIDMGFDGLDLVVLLSAACAGLGLARYYSRRGQGRYKLLPPAKAVRRDPVPASPPIEIFTMNLKPPQDEAYDRLSVSDVQPERKETPSVTYRSWLTSEACDYGKFDPNVRMRLDALREREGGR